MYFHWHMIFAVGFSVGESVEVLSPQDNVVKTLYLCIKASSPIIPSLKLVSEGKFMLILTLISVILPIAKRSRADAL